MRGRRVGDAFWLAMAVAFTNPMCHASPFAQAVEAVQAGSPEADVDVTVDARRLAGEWTVTVQGRRELRARLVIEADAKDVKRVTGTLTMLGGDDPIEGAVDAGRVTWRLTFVSSAGEPVVVTFAGRASKDGSLVGTMDFGPAVGPIPWRAARDNSQPAQVGK